MVSGTFEPAKPVPFHITVEFWKPHVTPSHTAPRGERLNTPKYIWYVLEFHLPSQ